MSVINIEKLDYYTRILWNKMGGKFSINSLLSDNKSKTHIAEKFELTSKASLKQVLSIGDSVQVTAAVSRTMAGNKSANIPANTFVGRIQFGVCNYKIGDIVNGCSIYAVKMADNTILEALVVNESATVVKSKIYQNTVVKNAVEFEINKAFNEDVYFIAGCNYIQSGKKGMAIGLDNNNCIAFDRDTEGTVLEEGFQITATTKRSPTIVIFGENDNLATAFKDYRADSRELVRFDGTTVQISGFRSIGEVAKVGEIKTFAFDIGKSTEIGGKTWTRCDGQVIYKNEDGTLSMVNNKAVDPQESITLPHSEEGRVLYVCSG